MYIRYPSNSRTQILFHASHYQFFRQVTLVTNCPMWRIALLRIVFRRMALCPSAFMCALRTWRHPSTCILFLKYAFSWRRDYRRYVNTGSAKSVILGVPRSRLHCRVCSARCKAERTFTLRYAQTHVGSCMCNGESIVPLNGGSARKRYIKHLFFVTYIVLV